MVDEEGGWKEGQLYYVNLGTLYALMLNYFPTPVDARDC